VATHGARIVGIGETDPAIGLTQSSTARGKDLRITLMSMFNTPDLSVPLARLGRLFGDGEFGIEVARTYPLSEAGEAQRAVIEDSFLGKLVLTP
jgi:NADPH:quinone reductase-like Zn-dependent oxidoreductase